MVPSRSIHRRTVFEAGESEELTKPGTNQYVVNTSSRGVVGPNAGIVYVLVQGEDAWVFYFTHPGRVPGAPPQPPAVRDVEPYALRRTSIQVAKLELEGTEIVCRRDEPFPFRLQPGVDNYAHGAG